ncbi:lytic transglycosylase domain-containing protein [Sphingomonas tagetis]|uniref:lytic transglycosylase domain-containing protein n=1 Tax=Sphingomonas tagetis TaxID=2949092 RepID=UPI00345E2351
MIDRRIWGHACAWALAMTLTVEDASASGRRDPAGERRIAACIKAAAEGRPWLETTLWGLRDQEGGWIGAELRNRDGSHDLGPLQVNSWWVSRLARMTGRSAADVRSWLRYDPCFNVQAARWILLTGLQTTRNYWLAVGAYHSPTAHRRKRYALAVARHIHARSVRRPADRKPGRR